MSGGRTAPRRPRTGNPRAGLPRISPRRLQARLAEVGRIRLGERLFRGPDDTKGYPSKLDTMRFTSPSKPLIERVADLYGGTVEPYVPLGGGAGQWGVKTPISRIPIIVPPRPYTQYMEAWSQRGCLRRCDGEFERKSRMSCLCLAEDHEICLPYTRMSVMLRDVPGLGVWRLESHGWNAAAELPDMLEFLARAGHYVSAELYLKPQRAPVDGQICDFIVPGLDIDLSPGQLAGGELSSGTAAHELRGNRAVLPAAPQPPDHPRDAADEDADPRQVLAAIEQAGSRGEVVRLRQKALMFVGRGLESEQVNAACNLRIETIRAEADQLRGEIVTAWPGERTDELTAAFTAFADTSPGEASMAQLQQFLKAILSGQIGPTRDT